MYSPKLNQELVQRLYRVCQELKVPMTVFVNGVLERALLRAEEELVMGEKEMLAEAEQQRPAVAAG